MIKIDFLSLIKMEGNSAKVDSKQNTRFAIILPDEDLISGYDSTKNVKQMYAMLNEHEFHPSRINFYKILNGLWKHQHMQYKIGLNVDCLTFDPTGSCRAGGLYFTSKQHLDRYVTFGDFVAEIEIPDGASVYVEPCGMKCKADKFIIKKVWFKIDYPENKTLFAEESRDMDCPLLSTVEHHLLYKFYYIRKHNIDIYNTFSSKNENKTPEEHYDWLVSNNFIVPFNDMDYITIYNTYYKNEYVERTSNVFKRMFVRPSDIFLSYVACRQPKLLDDIENLNPLVSLLRADNV